MKKFAIVLAAALAASAFAGKCNVAKPIASIEKDLGIKNIMAGARQTQEIESENGIEYLSVFRKARIKNGKFKGLNQENMYLFNDCVLSDVLLQKVDPKTDEAEATARAFVRPNGKLKAVCAGTSDLYTPNPMTGDLIINEGCECYDEDGKPAAFSPTTGCMDGDDYANAVRAARRSVSILP